MVNWEPQPDPFRPPLWQRIAKLIHDRLQDTNASAFGLYGIGYVVTPNTRLDQLPVVNEKDIETLKTEREPTTAVVDGQYADIDLLVRDFGRVLRKDVADVHDFIEKAKPNSC